MIKVNSKKQTVELDGTTSDLLSELSFIIRALNKSISEELINTSVKLGLTPFNELPNVMIDLIKDKIKNIESED